MNLEATRSSSSRSKSNTEIAIQTIKKLIIENELQPGSNHLESELAAKLGMSRTPVREATLILEAQGLLEIVPRHGVKILPLSISDMVEVYQVLTALEGTAAELAAQKSLDADAFVEAEKAILMMDEALETDDRETWAVADEKFHNELIRLADNSRIKSIVSVFNDQVRRARALTLYLRPSPTKSNEDHRRLLDAIKAGDAVAAKTIHTEHRVRAGAMLISILEKHKLILV
ncbi:GntR family transcriptional regulator [Ahrensia marina]|uniref:GntR family transcriptional regulator n=1 Tax=Ahrensia marina TaxID=1514904 RepID=A0A0N0VM77_9HYPH|nr:GntR family transcriptional regulator [Ahrensia marina]KPB02338.1 GntR family transcriptional regulator [Ahrensia marina]